MATVLLCPWSWFLHHSLCMCCASHLWCLPHNLFLGWHPLIPRAPTWMSPFEKLSSTGPEAGSPAPLHPCSFAFECLCVCVSRSGCVQLFATTWTVAPLSMGSSRQKYWSGLPFPSFSRASSWPRDQAQISHIAGGFFTVWATRETQLPYLGWLFPV